MPVTLLSGSTPTKTVPPSALAMPDRTRTMFARELLFALFLARAAAILEGADEFEELAAVLFE